MTGNGSLDDDRRDLQALLQKALMLELSTIPPYATACYTIKEQGQYDRSSPEIVNAEPIEVLRQVMVEEMLHMVLVANVLNAIGGSPSLKDPKQLPRYPHALLDGKGPTVHLRRFTPAQVKAFREVERAPDRDKHLDDDDYHTIGGFYLFIIRKLNAACDRHGEDQIFTDRAGRRQIGPDQYYGAGGEVIVVDGKTSALHALTEIMEEGEGADHGGLADDGDLVPGPEKRRDIAHYFKFNEILHSRYYLPDDHVDGPPTGGDLMVDWNAVWPMQDDPKGENYGGDPQIAALSDRFNESWSTLLDGLDAAFNGEKERLLGLVPLMYRLKEDAERLMRVPIRDGTGETAGPTWQYRG